MRSDGSRSTRILSIAVTPFACSSRSARMQYGQTAVVYIVIAGAVISPLHGQSGVLPCKVAAGEVVDVLDAQLRQGADGAPAAAAALAVDDDGPRGELG